MIYDGCAALPKPNEETSGGIGRRRGKKMKVSCSVSIMMTCYHVWMDLLIKPYFFLL